MFPIFLSRSIPGGEWRGGLLFFIYLFFNWCFSLLQLGYVLDLWRTVDVARVGYLGRGLYRKPMTFDPAFISRTFSRSIAMLGFVQAP